MALADRGFDVLGVELGGRLAAVARRRLAAVPSGLFDEVLSRRHAWTVEYTADEYIAVIGTYSDNLALPDEQRWDLFARIHARIAERGTVEKTYPGLLNVAR